jgi:two-component system, cell cycle sensor histidine kinase and response regulator CckA
MQFPPERAPSHSPAADDVRTKSHAAEIRKAEPYAEGPFDMIAALETQLEGAKRLATLGLVTRSVAHDLNNLLCIIDAYADGIVAGASIDVVADAARIRDAVARAADMTGQLLAGATAGGRCVDGAVIDLHCCITEMASLLSRLAGNNIRITYAFESPHSRVRLARTLLDQIVFNLIANARDAMPEGGEIVLRTVDSPFPLNGNTALVLEIADTGTGMSDDVKARIFEPFFSTKAPGRGTGLGLRTVQGIVQGAGGDIVVDSTVGGGATFRVFLPVATD